jgi:AcrR family transcriptional regulator
MLAAAQKQQRRNNLLQAAWRCASRKGFRELTVDEICEEAGVSKGTFYGYFASKQDLLVALLEQDAAEREVVLEALGAASDGVDRLQGFARVMLQRGEDPARVQIQADLWATVATDAPVHEAFRQSIRRRREIVRDWIDASIDAGELVDVPPIALASILLALGDGLLLHAALDPGSFQWPKVSKTLLLLLEGLRP